jgi:hypothetical protein
MTGPDRGFQPSELQPEVGPGPSDTELADATAAARDLEALAVLDTIVPSVGFDDRVMAAIEVEAPVRLVITSGRTLRGGMLAGFLVSFRDAWRVAAAPGRPFAVRAQALAFVLIAVVALGSLTTVAAVGAATFLSSAPGPSPTPTVTVAPTTGPVPSASPDPVASPTPTASGTDDDAASPSGTAEPTETAEPSHTAKPTATDDHHETPRPTKTAKPTETPEPTDTDEPDGTDDHGGGKGPG